jgi:tripartite-type tricarboxylate transporter receptor subunit TctC
MLRRETLKRLKGLGVGVAAWTLGSQTLSALAQSADAFPSRSLKVVVPQPAGGGFDFVARVLADKMAQGVSTGVMVENRTGSGTLVGTDFVAKAPADGYTLLLGSVSNMVLNAGLYKNLSYDPVKDFEPLGLAVGYSYTLVSRLDAKLKTLKDWLDYARASWASHLCVRRQWNGATCDCGGPVARGRRRAHPRTLPWCPSGLYRFNWFQGGLVF